MGRVNRLMERRVLRRAADEALLTPAFVRSIDIPPGTAPRVDTASHVDDADRWRSLPDGGAREPLDAITEPIPVTALHDRLRNPPADVELDDVPAAEHAPDLPAAAIGMWEPAVIEPRRLRVGPPWYRTKPVAALAAIAAAAIVASAVLLVLRGSEQTTTVAPEASTTAAPHPSSGRPAPSSAPPAASNAPAAPLPPPPAPPPAPPASPSLVVRNDDSWTPSPPSPSKKPEIGVTRAPSFSATPPPPPAPGKNSATPGDAPRRHWGFW